MLVGRLHFGLEMNQEKKTTKGVKTEERGGSSNIATQRNDMSIRKHFHHQCQLQYPVIVLL